MPKNKIGLQFKGFEELAAKLDELAGTDGIKRAIEAGLKTSKQYVNGELEKVLQPSNLPAHGIYSEGETLKSINKDFSVKWDGMQASVDVGLDFKKSGMTSIFLMYGTPKHPPVKGLYDAIYGKKTQSNIKKLQETAVNQVIKRTMEG